MLIILQGLLCNYGSSDVCVNVEVRVFDIARQSRATINVVVQGARQQKVLFGGLPGMCDMKTHSNNCSGPLVGNALGKVILISTPRDANTRYNRMTSMFLNVQSCQPGHEGCMFKLPTRLRGTNQAGQCFLS